MNMRAWWRGTPEQRYAVGVYWLYMVMLVVLPLVHLPAFRTNVGLIYLTKVAAFWVLTLAMLLWFGLQRRDFRQSVIRRMMTDRPLFWSSAAVLATVAVSFACAPDRFFAAIGEPHNWAGLISYASVALFICLSVPALRLIPRRRLLDPAYAAFSVLAMAILAQFLVGDFLFGQGRGAAVAAMAGLGNRNYAAMPYSWLFLLATVESLQPACAQRRRLFLMIPLILAYGVVLASLTRAVWLALAAALLLLIWFTASQRCALTRQQRQQALLIALVLIVTPPLLNGLSHGALIARIDHTAVALNGGPAALEVASSGRWGIWRAGIALLAEPRTLLVGVGPNRFYDAAMTSPLVQRLNWQPINTNLHNQYLESLVTLGIPGLMALLSFGAVLLLRAYRLARRSAAGVGLWLSLAALVVNLLFISINFSSCVYFWPLAAAVIAEEGAS